MPINLDTESIISLTEATKVLPYVNGRRPAISTIWRWCRKGINGVQLEYIRMGRNIATSREALSRFFEALAKADSPPPTAQANLESLKKPTPNAMRQVSLAQADRILQRAGITK